MKGLGIHFRLLLSAILLISATTFALGYLGINIAHQFVRTRFDERILFLARYIALNSELGILIGDRSMLTRLSQNLLSEKDVVRVLIFGEENEILADEFREETGSLSKIEVPVILKEKPVFPWNLNRQRDNLEIGRVRVIYSTEGINQLLTTMKKRFLWLSLFMALVAVISFYFISRSIVAPVTRLSEAVREVARGHLAHRVKPGRLPETRNLAIAFNAMLDSLETSQKELEETQGKMIRQQTLAEVGKFSMMIAHEVKNPLSIIKSSLDVLKKKIDGSSENLMVLYIEDEIKRLNQLIEDFLSFARPTVPNFRKVDVNAHLSECVNRFKMQFLDMPVEIVDTIPSEPCYLKVDPDLLMRSISNVLKNAVDAIDLEGSVLIEAGQIDRRWRVEISDQGPGVPEEILNKIFEPFFTTRSKGTGLGLAFTAQVISAHGGRVYAENMRETGACFRIELPILHELNTKEAICHESHTDCG